MKRILLFAIAMLAPGLACAEVGIGGSVRGDTVTIYVPITVGDSLRVEPYFSWLDQNASGPAATDYQSLLAGVGLFKLAPIAKDLRLLGGARASYVRSEVTNSPCCSGDSHGYSVEPTLGAEYLITERLGVALEEYLFYYKASGSNTGVLSGVSRMETAGTGNRLIVRFMF